MVGNMIEGECKFGCSYRYNRPPDPGCGFAHLPDDEHRQIAERIARVLPPTKKDQAMAETGITDEQLDEFKSFVSQWEQTGMAAGAVRRFVIAVKEIERLRAENDKYRAALERIAAMTNPGIVAWEALSVEPSSSDG